MNCAKCRGKVGLCCNDCFEITNYGNVETQKLSEIWNCAEFVYVREQMQKGRQYFEFCKECDVVDTGFREKIIGKKQEK